MRVIETDELRLARSVSGVGRVVAALTSLDHAEQRSLEALSCSALTLEHGLGEGPLLGSKHWWTLEKRRGLLGEPYPAKRAKGAARRL